MEELKEYVARRIRHANNRCQSARKLGGDKPVDNLTFHAGQSLGYWQGALHAYLNVLEEIDEMNDIGTN